MNAVSGGKRDRRVLLKLSGEALMGNAGHGIDVATVARFASDIAAARQDGVEIAIVVGGGNIFRGLAASASGLDRTTADSMGMLATVMNALALAGAPRFILFDEPAAGLSPTERRELIEILVNLPSHMGYIIIEHDMDVALRVAESVTMMHNGAIFKEGRPEEIEEDPEVQELYLGGGHG